MPTLVSKRKRTKRPYKRIKQNYKKEATQSLTRGFLVGLAFTIFSSISSRKDIFQHPRERCSPSKTISYLWVYIVQSVITIISLKIGHCILDQRDSILSSTVASKSHLMPAKHQAPKGHLKNKFSSVSSTLWCSNHNLRS